MGARKERFMSEPTLDGFACVENCEVLTFDQHSVPSTSAARSTAASLHEHSSRSCSCKGVLHVLEEIGHRMSSCRSVPRSMERIATERASAIQYLPQSRRMATAMVVISDAHPPCNSPRLVQLDDGTRSFE